MSLRERLEREIPIFGVDAREVRALHAESRENAVRYHEALEDLEGHCLFIGYPRSGHSLVGAVLDAHPDMVIAHELDVMKFMEAGFDHQQIQYLLIENARRCGEAGRIWGRNSYAVPGGWQGRFRAIKILGDKKGGATTHAIGAAPERLDALRDFLGGRLTFVHVVRNPFDMIPYMHRFLARDHGYHVSDTANLLLAMIRVNAHIRERLGPAAVIDVWHEELVNDPKGELKRLCAFLGVEAEADYLEACAAIVRPSPRRSRDQLTWPPEVIRTVEEACARYDFLRAYGFDT